MFLIEFLTTYAYFCLSNDLCFKCLQKVHSEFINGGLDQLFCSVANRRPSTDVVCREFVDSPFVYYKFVSHVMSCDP